ncbi:MAG: GntR family transcriptional regulator [Schumannella sp.]|nr:GntR family transcriptional regulator [Microbacteriaceae bacterium]
MLLRIAPDSGAPIFEQLAASVRAELARGGLRVGDRLPGAREVSAALEVNIHTVLKAYQLLRDEGLIDLRRGRGAVIAAGAVPPSGMAEAVRDLVARARRHGVSAESLIALIREEYPR